MPRAMKIKMSRSDRIFTNVNYLFLTVVLVVIFYPLIIVVSSSFSEPQAVISGKVWLFPVGLNFKGYQAVFRYQKIIMGFVNTIIYTVGGTLFGVSMTLLAAYPLSRRDLYGKGILTFIFTFTMLFSGGLIPSYLLNKALGLVDNRMMLVIAGSMSVYNIIITRTFFRSTLSEEILEATQIDGCDDFNFFLRFVIPLSSTIIAVLVLFIAVGHWNSYQTAIIYIRTESKLPLQIILRNILILSQTAALSGDVSLELAFSGMQDLIKYALIVVASAPILALYPFVQKYFVKGVMIGSLKG
ncbi:MAG: carbohydrate ABC transporter permease [Clostridiales bacterium]|nr:carbohydrate ABC transporter permease [Clostridiales bacterium]